MNSQYYLFLAIHDAFAAFRNEIWMSRNEKGVVFFKICIGDNS